MSPLSRETCSTKMPLSVGSRRRALCWLQQGASRIRRDWHGDLQGQGHSDRIRHVCSHRRWKIDRDGNSGRRHLSIAGPIGEYEVAVAAIAEVAEGRQGFEQKTPRPLLPERFSFPSRSGLVVTVSKQEQNEADLKMP